MAEVGYNSKFEGLEVDSRLENVVQAAPGTGSESGKGGLIPAPPAGSQDGSKTLLSNMTWGDHVTKQYIDDAVSAAGWKKQIVSKLPTVEEAKDNVMYLVKDNVASTETKNVYNEYILVTEEGGTKVLESLGMVSTGVDSNYLDLSMFLGNSGTLDEASFGKVLDAYNNKITLGKSGNNYYSLDYFLDGRDFEGNFELRIILVSFSDTNPGEGVSESDIEIQVGTYTVTQDKTYKVMNNMVTLSNTILSYLKFMATTPKVVTTLANLPKGAHNIIANVSSATNLSMAVSSDDVGREWQVRVNNTTSNDITQPLPTSGLFQSMSGDSVIVPKNSFIELSIWYINDKLVIRVGEQA
jgi:hypothetical protein